LNPYGGTAAILREAAPPPLEQWAAVDALVVSTDNELAEDTSAENALTEDPMTEDGA
jgi:hypothetical protein